MHCLSTRNMDIFPSKLFPRQAIEKFFKKVPFRSFYDKTNIKYYVKCHYLAGIDLACKFVTSLCKLRVGFQNSQTIVRSLSGIRSELVFGLVMYIIDRQCNNLVIISDPVRIVSAPPRTTPVCFSG